MRGIITVVGKDMVGILAKVSGVCAERPLTRLRGDLQVEGL